jgi:hypothetical protein
MGLKGIDESLCYISFASIEGLKSTGISYRTVDMLFRTRKSISGGIWIWYNPDVDLISCGYPRKRNRCAGKRGINFWNFVLRPNWTDHCKHVWHYTRARTRLLTEWQERRNGSHYYYSIVPGVSTEAWMASTIDDRDFLVARSRLGSNHTGTRAHLQRINVVQDAFCLLPVGYDYD